MIETTKAFKTSDGTTHGSLEDAQRHQLGLLLDLKIATGNPLGEQASADVAATDGLIAIVIERILEKREGVIAILNVKTRKPRAKKNSTPAPRTRRTNVPSPGTEAATQQQLA